MHFYEQTAHGVAPRHFVQQTSDPTKTRPSRVTDAKKAAKSGEIWYPSVTGILDVLDKPALKNWHIEQHLQTIWDSWREDEFQPGSDMYSWFKAIKAATQERLDEAPKAGSDIHAILEQFLFSGSIPPGIEGQIVKNIEECLTLNCGNLDWEKEIYFVNQDVGYAGQMDLVADNKTAWVIDYKSKQTAEKFNPGKMAYDEHKRQLAAYGKAFFPERNFMAANIFICLENGEVDFDCHSFEDIEHGWADFKDCLSLYHRNKWNPLDYQ